ncbi:hypothetical protein NLG97_g7527 [Lecanicillium saksenae]|uniref:Uncharacterized protein n=1 Tax=Lecanicillium saksenae TaxID=468837 RepID=A0ACC1QNE8_9HYPO|nr:hypothetical protein NLG97_g7527 [Lecanicillium saksenae]
MGLDTEAGGQRSSAGNYVAFVTAGGRPRIGTLDFNTSVITAVAYNSGAPVSSLYEVIELGDAAFTSTAETFPLDKVKLLPPLSGRDVLAVGKNYVEHAEEFHSSGFDSSDKNAQPTHPVIFTKRATSIIAHNDEIFPHPDFSTSVDYEGEIGVIVGKPGFRVAEADAMDHVWGYTIVNDMTARERQRDHKQFYIGKSADTFCPMGPVAVPKERLPETLALRTYVNGEKRQEADTSQLIFSVPFLINTLSEGSTLRAGRRDCHGQATK